MSVDVLSDIKWFRRERGEKAPVVLTVYHGTTHRFDSFSGDRVNTENMFGRQVYFTSCPDDAERNYASVDGPDLKNRMEHAAELAWNAEEHKSYEEALTHAKNDLYGGEEAVLTVEITLKKPLILGLNAPHSVISDEDDLFSECVSAIAAENDVSEEEVMDDTAYSDKLSERIDEIRSEEFERFSATISEALDRLNMTKATDSAESVLFTLFSEEWSADKVFEKCRDSEPYVYLFEDENYTPCCVPVIAEIFHLMGHEAIIQLNADEKCRNMDMVAGTSHIALSVDCLEQARIIDRREISREAEFSLSA